MIKKKNTSLEDELSKLKAAKDENNNDELISTIGRLAGSITDLRKENRRLGEEKKQNKILKDELAKLKAVDSTIRGENETFKTNIGELTTTVERLIEENANLKAIDSTLRGSKEELIKVQKHNQSLEDEIGKLKAEWDKTHKKALTATIERLIGEKSDLKATLKDENSYSQSSNEELVKVQERLVKEKNTSKHLEDEIDKLQAVLDGNNEMRDGLTATIERLVGENCDLKAINSTVRDENSTLAEINERVIGEKDWELSALSSVKDKLEADKHSLKKQRHGLTETNRSLRAKVEELRKIQAGFI